MEDNDTPTALYVATHPPQAASLTGELQAFFQTRAARDAFIDAVDGAGEAGMAVNVSMEIAAQAVGAAGGDR